MRNKQINTVYLAILLFFAAFIIIPAVVIFTNAFNSSNGSLSFAAFQNEESYPVDCRYHCINNLII